MEYSVFEKKFIEKAKECNININIAFINNLISF